MKYYAKLEKPYYPSGEKLLEYAEFLLKGMGYTEDEIKRQITIGPFVVDIVGQSKNRTTAIELGQCGYRKLFVLETYCDDVIWLPYWFTRIQLGNEKQTELEQKIHEHKNKSLRLTGKIEGMNEDKKHLIKRIVDGIVYAVGLDEILDYLCEDENLHRQIIKRIEEGD